jgi:DNA-directed RNA polymerase
MTDFSASIQLAAASTDMNKPKETQITQEQLEKEMAAFGKARAERMMGRNEDAGSADNNPYAKAIFNRYVMPLAAIIKADITTKKPGRNQAHVTLLEPMDPEAIAFLAVRAVLNDLLNGGKFRANGDGDTTAMVEIMGRNVMTTIGKVVYHELMLSMFSEEAPELFYTLVNDLGRRLSKSERHRLNVFRIKMKEAGIPVPEWGAAGTQQIGAYLLDQLATLGMVDIDKRSMAAATAKQVRNSINVRLSEDCLDLVSQIKEMVAETTPYYLPCIEQPKDWVSIMDGGYHTNDMRRMSPFCIKSQGAWSEVAEHDLTRVFAAINALQRVEWQVNGQMLDTIRQVARHFDMDEIISQAENPAPLAPDWLSDGMKQDDMSPDEVEQFKIWKRAKREWYTQMKLRGTKFGRFVTATGVAQKFRSFDKLHFVYFADFRGRLYVQTTGISPQGSDMQKALIRFAKGEPLDSVDAERWFCINGANKFGYDKATLDDRVKWCKDHEANILSFAADPISNRGWQDADSPLQFLAWCFEYAEWFKHPETFVSHLPVGMDGSCNGLQNFSAMLRDEIGGKATNLTPSALPNDIYGNVADVTMLLLRRTDPRSVPDADEDDAESMRARNKAELANKHRLMWLKHGITRSLVKRSVMTLPYGSTRFSCADFIVGDYLKEGKAPEFSREEYGAAAQFLSHFVWEAIGEVVVKATDAMEWLQKNTKTILSQDTGVRWMTPIGFPVIQYYQEQDLHRINTKLCGNTKIRVNQDSQDKPSLSNHKNGIAPNFIHSHDAAHMKLVILAAAAEGMALAMIHDDFGTHARNAATLYRIIREQFVAMYEGHDPLADLAAAYELTSPPEKGSLDLRQVLISPYFFS